MAKKRLTRSNSNAMLAGVLGGIGEFLRIDPTFIRLIYTILFIFTVGFPMFLLYVACAIIIPKSDVYIK